MKLALTRIRNLIVLALAIVVGCFVILNLLSFLFVMTFCVWGRGSCP